MNRIGVMQITDTLAPGGLERVAVNLANGLPPDCYRSYICATRHGGVLEKQLSAHVTIVQLNRKGRFDLKAIHRLAAYISEQRIQILHAHGTSLFIAAIASLFQKNVSLIWHDHFGCFETERRSAVYRIAANVVDGVISVTEPLARWAEQTLRVNKVWYISNFATAPSKNESALVDLPGKKGSRIVCVANLRPQKDHLNLLRALAMIVSEMPEAHLLLLGADGDSLYRAEIEKAILGLNLGKNVSWLGSRSDVHAVLKNCDIGVLSSSSEGLPLSLLEYGMAGLPAVATNVGQCAEVLGHGSVGILIPPSSPETLAQAIQLFLRSPEARDNMARKFQRHVAEHYSAEAVLKKICDVYQSVLGLNSIHV